MKNGSWEENELVIETIRILLKLGQQGDGTYRTRM